ncbi:MAG: response regulator transcription factor [Clostridiales bacterium]|nr:response regulator transcription factor [Clostridiales bacterium]
MDDGTQKILVVEDDANIRELVAWNLSEEGYECVCAADGKEGIDAARLELPDLILLDLMLPGLDGFEVVKTLRREGLGTPIIMLTAKNEETDKVIGLEFGADDYITKPFGIRELKARIKAVLRRYRSEDADTPAGAEDGEGPGESVYTIGDLVIDVPGHEVFAKGSCVVLTLKEFELLRMLAENRGRVLTREQLLDSIWGYEYPGETRTVDVHIRYLRRKLEGAGDCIMTVRGLGYKLI